MNKHMCNFQKICDNRGLGQPGAVSDKSNIRQVSSKLCVCLFHYPATSCFLPLWIYWFPKVLQIVFRIYLNIAINKGFLLEKLSHTFFIQFVLI